MQYKKLTLAAGLCVLGTHLAMATPTPEEAAQLGKTLTPFGAIKAGNKEGTIPEWTGGECKPPANYKPKYGLEEGGGPFPDPFAADKPLFKITAENLAKYADKVDEGTKELFKRYPKTFYMNVYPTHRSACYPNWVYENTIKRVMNPKVVGGAIPSLDGAHAQIPFPIPKNGYEAQWNKLTALRYGPVLTTAQYITYYADPSGNRSMIDSDWQYSYIPYWDNSITKVPDDKPYVMQLTNKVYPPAQAGNQMLMHMYLRPDLKGDPVWSYIPGQRRVRVAPEFAYDGVAPSAGGTYFYDEASGFAGKMDKYDMKLLGRMEYYIPYNNSEERMNKAERVTPNHLDPEAVRWELHRVWVVEMNLKPNERHVHKKKVNFLDEDSWQAALYYGVDGGGKIHKVYHFHLGPFYEDWGIRQHAYNGYDLSKGAYTHWMFTGTGNGITTYGTRKVKSIPALYFTPEGMKGGGVR